MLPNILRNSIRPQEILKAPNLLSLLRLALIPLVLYYYSNGQVRLAGILLIASALTDVADGFIARRFKLITNLGKMLDPLADKLTQICVAICLCISYKALLPLALVLVIKDLLMLCMGLTLLRRGKQPFSARWWGKTATVAFYTAVSIIMLFGDSLSPASIWAISSTVVLLMGYSMIRYYYMLRYKLAEM
ncbi:MAG: CDP-alcohol phosphatidyltransferase family protein [Clostridiales bacterium]|nr:CDP-alcohol phosphatidyltransferase family protein [Clostridiales bacterium]